MHSALAKLKQLILEAEKGADSREWAASTSDDKIICALPAVLNKKHFTKLSFADTLEKLD